MHSHTAKGADRQFPQSLSECRVHSAIAGQASRWPNASAADMGAGLLLARAADFVIASDRARFSANSVQGPVQGIAMVLEWVGSPFARSGLSVRPGS